MKTKSEVRAMFRKMVEAGIQLDWYVFCMALGEAVNDEE